MKFRKLQQKKTYQTWLASYLIIIAVAVLCSAVFHILLTNVINRTVGQANEKVLHDIKMTMDFYIEDMRNLAAELSYSSAVDSLMSAQGEGEYIYYAEQLKNELGNYKVLNTKIDNIYIYSARHDSVISPERVASSDLLYEMDKIVPQEDHYRHFEGNSAAHLKSSLFGFSQQMIVTNGKLLLGRWQGIYFCEFDGPRSRNFYVKITD